MNLKHRTCLGRVSDSPKSRVINLFDRRIHSLENKLGPIDDSIVSQGVFAIVLRNSHELQIRRDVGRTINRQIGFSDIY